MNSIWLYADKCLTVNFLKKIPALKDFQFPWCKYSHPGCFQATDVMMMSWEEMHKLVALSQCELISVYQQAMGWKEIPQDLKGGC